MMTLHHPVLVTGAAGKVGAVGRRVAELLLSRNLPVRAFVRQEDPRAQALRDLGAQVVVGDLTHAPTVVEALAGCRAAYFSLSVSDQYLEAAVTFTAAARQAEHLELLVNMSQMTVSQMSLTSVGESRQQKLHWLAEQAMNWSGVPVTHVRPTIFMENPLLRDVALKSIETTGTIRLPFGSARTSPVAASDVAEVVAAALTEPTLHTGRVYELTGGTVRDMAAIATEYSDVLRRPVIYDPVPFEEWTERDLVPLNFPPHLVNHLATMAQLHAQGRYDRLTDHVLRVTGHEPVSLATSLLANRSSTDA
ncbi:NAD(P)H-binding protein [Streptomyces sp. NPDC090080]|uniref:NAD(P)H-binding protein n=1 Tax=Streptomyces sp. NPDC090080 TaxID=3365939 RepID=UPI003808C6E1